MSHLSAAMVLVGSESWIYFLGGYTVSYILKTSKSWLEGKKSTDTTAYKVQRTERSYSLHPGSYIGRTRQTRRHIDDVQVPPVKDPIANRRNEPCALAPLT